MKKLGRDDWPQLELENSLEYMLYLGSSPLAEKHIADDIAWVITGVEDNTFNGVARTHLTGEIADGMIAEVVIRFRARGLPALWYVLADSQPSDLAQRLVYHGCFELDAGVGMAADLSTMNEQTREVPGLTIRRVTNAQDMALWSTVYDYDRAQREPLYTSLGFAEQPLRHYLALLDNQPVATASAFLGARAAGLYHVQVVEEAQGKGIGTAIALAPLRDARALGYPMAVLGPTPESWRMYERIGFVPHQCNHRYFEIEV